MKKNDPILVTGAAGFIGSHLTELLIREGYHVRAFVHYNSSSHWGHLEDLSKEVKDSIEIFPGDIGDGFSVNRAVKGCSTVFHLAALIGIPYSYNAPGSYVHTNITGTLNILEACRAQGVERLLHTSTSETYGTAQYVPIDEKHPLVGQSPYSASKIGADKLVESYWLSFEYPVTIVRPFNTYGPRQSMRAIIPTIIVQGLTKDVIRLGNLDPIRDLTYVSDTAHGFLSAARSQQVVGETVNLGVGSGISVGELVDLVSEILDRKLEVETDSKRIRPTASEVNRLISDNSKMKHLTEWEPKVPIKTGLTNTIEYIQKHLNHYKPDQYIV